MSAAVAVRRIVHRLSTALEYSDFDRVALSGAGGHKKCIGWL
jgi:hypothetical protein